MKRFIKYLFIIQVLILYQAPANGAKPYKYTGKELDMEHGLMLYDYGARQYDPTIGRFLTMDPLAEKYYSISPYAYCANNPIKFVDPNGEDLYLYYYMSDNYKHGRTDDATNKMFWVAALTQAMNIAKNLKDGDKAILKSVSSTSDFKSTIEGDIAANKDDYGKTKEVGIWSHGGFDGPLRHDQSGKTDQMPVSEWGNIDFNWSENASIGFYGCQTGRTNEYTGLAFNERLSTYDNFKNVDVLGQTRQSWPSPYANVRKTTSDIRAGNHQVPTYMVGSSKNMLIRSYTVLGITSAAYPMSIYRNGQFIRNTYQSGNRFRY
jgi:RHS repeat-associated protein